MRWAACRELDTTELRSPAARAAMAQLLMVGVYQPALGISGALPIDHVVRSSSWLPPAC